MLCAQWSHTSEFQLAAGDASGKVLVWDVRRAGALLHLDLQRTVDGHVDAGGGADKLAGPAGEAGAAPGGHSMLRHSPGYAQAHRGAVTGLLQTADGRHWVTAGADSAVRLWEAGRGRNCLVRFPEAFNSATAGRQLALDASSQVCVLRPPRAASLRKTHAGQCLCGRRCSSTPQGQ